MKQTAPVNFKKIVFFDVKDWEREEIAKVEKDFEVKLCEEPLTIKNASEFKDAEVISVFINSAVNAEVLAQFPNLHLVTTRSTGFDHIDTKYCQDRGIFVANVPHYGANTVAEHAMALILALSRRIVESVERVRKNDFSPLGLTGMDLNQKVIGVVGTGNIGKNLIRYANGFGMKVLAYDLYKDDKAASELGFTYVELDYLLGKSDVISLHLPYNDKTHHVINRDSVSKMKKGVLIVNTARGGLIETDALFDGLRTGQIGGAGLDVLEEEKFLTEELELLHADSHGEVDFKIALENHMMAYLPNVIITPHNAFNSHEALQRIIKTTIENILCFAKGSCDNLVSG